MKDLHLQRNRLERNLYLTDLPQELWQLNPIKNALHSQSIFDGKFSGNHIILDASVNKIFDIIIDIFYLIELNKIHKISLSDFICIFHYFIKISK